VNFVSFYDALRYANWLHNGKPTGPQWVATTEAGAYTFSGPTSAGARNPEAKVFIPSQDEWYKAAYYDGATGSYFDYPTASDTQTTCAAPADTVNISNCLRTGTQLTEVGSYTGSTSPTGTVDQGGNVWEWNDAIISGSGRILRGGGFSDLAGALAASAQNGNSPENAFFDVGFRVAKSLTPISWEWGKVTALGNACDAQSQGCFGAVAYPYQISKTEVTNAQYAKFLNAVAGSDPNGLYDTRMGWGHGGITRVGGGGGFTYSTVEGRDNWPVVFVSFYNALRFTNWLHNNQVHGPQGPSTTEDGAYTFSGPTSAGARNTGAKIFLPSEDEWYKAAYYNAATTSYFDYPAGSDTPMTCSGSGGTANCYPHVLHPKDVGSYPGSTSPTGTFDQGGNVWEWNDAITSGSGRVLRGGGFHDPVSTLAASYRNGNDPANAFSDVGFRLASRVACRDGLDNDGDRLVDYAADQGCVSADDDSERGAVIQLPGHPPFNTCDDGVDNDGDTLADYPADPGCAWPASYTENPRCSDGFDNDNDGAIDYPADLQCAKFWDTNEAAPGPQCGLGYELGVVLPLLWYLRDRRRRRA
jgi:formylglycine-generating enzyme required for sulfatase activity